MQEKEGKFVLHLAALHVVNVLIDACTVHYGHLGVPQLLLVAWPDVNCIDTMSTNTAPSQQGVLQGRLQEVAVEPGKQQEKSSSPSQIVHINLVAITHRKNRIHA